MIKAEEWDRLFERAAPIVSLGIGTLSVALGTMALVRASPLGQRLYHVDGQYLVSVRYPGQWHDLRDFIQPDNPDVAAIYGEIGPDIWGCLDWVCRNISYRQDIGEMFQFPSETLATGNGDCEDSSFLTCSLLKNFTNARVALGSFQGYGHAWCQLDGQIFETTYTLAKPVSDPEDYLAFVLFDEQDVIELWPGALAKVFDLARDEAIKLNLMAKALKCTLQ